LHNTKIVCRLPPKLVAIRSLTTGRFDINVVEDHAQRPMTIHSKELLCATEGCENIWTYASDVSPNAHTGICSTCRAKLSQDDKKKFTPLKKWEAYTPTNIRAEGLAILTALQAAQAKKKSGLRQVCLPLGVGPKTTLHGVLQPTVGMRRVNWNDDTTRILIVTDSLFWINVVTKWLTSWIQKKIVFEKKNSDIVCAIYDQLQTLAELNIAVEFQHIRGHQDKAIASDQLNLFHKGNILVDKLATHAMTMTDFDMHFC
jgi:ribonuclease HI